MDSSSFLFTLRGFHRQGTSIPLLKSYLSSFSPSPAFHQFQFQAEMFQFIHHDPILTDFPTSRHVSALFWRCLIDFVIVRSRQFHQSNSSAAEAETESLPLNTLLCTELIAHLQHVSKVEIELDELKAMEKDGVSHYQTPWFKVFDTPLKGVGLPIQYSQINENHSESSSDPSNTTNSSSATSLRPFSSFDCYADIPYFRHIYRVESGFLNNIGLCLWPAGYLMGDYILTNPSVFQGRRLLELGTGIGLTSVIASLTRPQSIIATDFQEKVLENIERNFKLNGLQKDPTDATTPDLWGRSLDYCRVSRLDWTQYTQDQIEAFGAFDCIIACDTTYIPEILVPFAKTVKDCLLVAEKARQRRRAQGEAEGPQPVAYLAQTERHPLYFIEYLDALRAEDLKIEEIETDEIPKRFLYDRDTIFLHRVTLKPESS